MLSLRACSATENDGIDTIIVWNFQLLKRQVCRSFNWTPTLMNQDNDNNQIHRLRHSAFTYSFFCLYVVLLHLSMPPKSKAPGSPTKKSIAKWNNAETKALILFLKSESDNMGTSSFKEASFTAAANHIKELHTDGPTKTALHCKNKWTSVGFLLSVITDRSNFFSSSWSRSSIP